MGTFQDAVSNIKQQIAEFIIDESYSNKYLINTCDIDRFKTYNGLKLELLLLDNTDYLTLTPFQTKKLLSGNYKNLFASDAEIKKILQIKSYPSTETNSIYI